MIRYLLAALLLLPACSSEDAAGTGDVALRISGGGSLTQGFPFTEGATTHAFVDGWTLAFDRYVFIIDAVEIGGGGWSGSLAVDLAATGNQGVALPLIEDLPAKRLDVGFTFAAATAATEAGEGVDAATLARLQAEGLSALIAGRAQKGGRTVTFEFGVAAPTRYARCSNGVDNTRGLVVEPSKATGAFVFIHAIHLFWDRIGTDAELRFEPFAAMADANDHLTFDALRGQDLNELTDADGARLRDEAGAPLFFHDDVGALGLDETTLADFFTEQVRLAVHFNGLGLCTSSRLD
jgi:hypothetical protein